MERNSSLYAAQSPLLVYGTEYGLLQQLYLLQSLEESDHKSRESSAMALRFRQNNFPYARNIFLLTF